ncbi:hypothetical protein QTI66_24105 [Variovorax sp. J22R133]|uniref:hypothetical protein n=1 Tax=Variovorax brevis TaxID=3053503 RepID=UPI002575F1C1|nr:hypothetical protein [Variovorax sp. J22R133]MDM0115255.1 hypothetical protein [Variovorax sp. J22R133]
MSASMSYCLVGVGSVFDAIAAETHAYGADAGWEMRPAAGVAQLAGTASALLAGIDPTTTLLFVAVDAQALNYARLELYGVARLAGLKMATLVHPTAWVSPGARLADNVWVGPGARVATGCRIDSNVMINVSSRIDEKARIHAHGWIGSGASLGACVQVGTHSAIGADVHVRAGLQIGRHCTIDHPGPWTRSLADGSFVEPEMPGLAQVVGAGYNFLKRS